MGTISIERTRDFCSRPFQVVAQLSYFPLYEKIKCRREHRAYSHGCDNQGQHPLFHRVGISPNSYLLSSARETDTTTFPASSSSTPSDSSSLGRIILWAPFPFTCLHELMQSRNIIQIITLANTHLLASVAVSGILAPNLYLNLKRTFFRGRDGVLGQYTDNVKLSTFRASSSSNNRNSADEGTTLLSP